MNFDFLSLDPVRQFSGAFRDDAYQEVPDDWWVIVTDVVNSTQAIEAGRYKDINMLGAAGITAVFNVVGGATIPFVFGGDGATFICSNKDRDAILSELIAVKSFGLQHYDLELRVGAMRVQEIRAQGKNVKVARLELTPGNNLALVKGGGLALADKTIKSDQSGKFCSADITENLPNLEGLSCRWQPLKPVNGKILTLLVQARDESDYARIVEEIEEILEKGNFDSNPVKPEDMKLLGFFKNFSLESFARSAGTGSKIIPTLGTVFEKIYQRFSHLINIKSGPYQPDVYLSELRSNSDFRKFDDMIRMVLDCEEDVISRIKNFLNVEAQKGILQYGLHLSDEALMTCLMLDLHNSQHLHFIDGADGGYAMAAKSLKSSQP